ncbi:MAG TPA: hypothetical protein VMV82_10890 [Candidatus Dormibacteraeota bacterium]|nr:hypothetical protein [Candidatus Dormibacteraeota bacterium]
MVASALLALQLLSLPFASGGRLPEWTAHDDGHAIARGGLLGRYGVR